MNNLPISEPPIGHNGARLRQDIEQDTQDDAEISTPSRHVLNIQLRFHMAACSTFLLRSWRYIITLNNKKNAKCWQHYIITLEAASIATKSACDSSLVFMISFCTGVDIMVRYQLLNNNNNNNKEQ